MSRARVRMLRFMVLQSAGRFPIEGLSSFSSPRYAPGDRPLFRQSQCRLETTMSVAVASTPAKLTHLCALEGDASRESALVMSAFDPTDIRRSLSAVQALPS